MDAGGTVSAIQLSEDFCRKSLHPHQVVVIAGNNPSIITEITKMRVEMLGTACTLQHSDARVLDQLLYKWPHCRAVIASVLQEEYSKLAVTGWVPTRAEIRRDVERFFGASYEEFMAKSLQHTYS